MSRGTAEKNKAECGAGAYDVSHAEKREYLKRITRGKKQEDKTSAMRAVYIYFFLSPAFSYKTCAMRAMI